MLSPGCRVRENTPGAKHGVGSSEGGGDAGEARAGAQAASQGRGDDVFDDKDHKDGNNDVFDDEDHTNLLLTMQAKVGVEAALVGELEAMREAVRVKEEEERLNEERETEKYV